MKKTITLITTILLLMGLCACSGTPKDPKEMTKLTEEQIQAHEADGVDCITFIGTNMAYTYEESVDGKVLADLDFGDKYGLKAFYDGSDIYAYINETSSWMKFSKDEVDYYELVDLLKMVPDIPRSASEYYLDARDLEVVDYKDGITYVQGKADNPYYDESERYTAYLVKFTLDGKEIVVEREVYEDFSLWDGTYLITGEYPEGFNMNNYDFDFDNNVLIYNGYYGEDTEQYRTDIPFELVDKETPEDLMVHTIVYEYNEEGKIIGLAIKDMVGDIIIKYSGLKDTLDMEHPENCPKGDLNTFANAFLRALAVSGLLRGY
ncbi:MAG: hypothetical protein IKS51_07875 [Erysipelotrichaceae bacterium]|nr:hypothetical protein [Erysipelotrichaceae bacterium]